MEQTRESPYVALEQNTVCTFWSLFPLLPPVNYKLPTVKFLFLLSYCSMKLCGPMSSNIHCCCLRIRGLNRVCLCIQSLCTNSVCLCICQYSFHLVCLDICLSDCLSGRWVHVVRLNTYKILIMCFRMTYNIEDRNKQKMV